MTEDKLSKIIRDVGGSNYLDIYNITKEKWSFFKSVYVDFDTIRNKVNNEKISDPKLFLDEIWKQIEEISPPFFNRIAIELRLIIEKIIILSEAMPQDFISKWIEHLDSLAQELLTFNLKFELLYNTFSIFTPAIIYIKEYEMLFNLESGRWGEFLQLIIGSIATSNKYLEFQKLKEGFNKILQIKKVDVDILEIKKFISTLNPQQQLSHIAGINNKILEIDECLKESGNSNEIFEINNLMPSWFNFLFIQYYTHEFFIIFQNEENFSEEEKKIKKEAEKNKQKIEIAISEKSYNEWFMKVRYIFSEFQEFKILFRSLYKTFFPEEMLKDAEETETKKHSIEDQLTFDYDTIIIDLKWQIGKDEFIRQVDILKYNAYIKIIETDIVFIRENPEKNIIDLIRYWYDVNAIQIKWANKKTKKKAIPYSRIIKCFKCIKNNKVEIFDKNQLSVITSRTSDDEGEIDSNGIIFTPVNKFKELFEKKEKN